MRWHQLPTLCFCTFETMKHNQIILQFQNLKSHSMFNNVTWRNTLLSLQIYKIRKVKMNQLGMIPQTDETVAAVEIRVGNEPQSPCTLSTAPKTWKATTWIVSCFLNAMLTKTYWNKIRLEKFIMLNKPWLPWMTQ